MEKEIEENYSENPVASFEMVDYMLSNPPQPPQTQMSLDKLSFTDVMQFADFGPKLALNQSRMPLSEDEDYFHYDDEEEEGQGPPASLPLPPPQPAGEEEDGGRFSENNSSVQQQQLGFGGGAAEVIKNRRKRPRAMKTTEEVESQRMTHIAVERNRRRQMNEHLRVLRSLMPGSYVQRGDQASIIGGAIEFVRELEQLLQCLESQKRRRIFGTNDQPPRNMTDAPPPPPLPLQQQPQQQQPFLPPLPLPGSSCDIDPNNSSSLLREDMAENKSCLADIEVRLLGADAMIKILSRRRPGQLIKIIAALEDLQFGILHTNITTIEQTVLYSFNVKIGGETRCTAEDIASSVQQILSFIDTSTI